jgi:hypothetical protein
MNIKTVVKSAGVSNTLLVLLGTYCNMHYQLVVVPHCLSTVALLRNGKVFTLFRLILETYARINQQAVFSGIGTVSIEDFPFLRMGNCAVSY